MCEGGDQDRVRPQGSELRPHQCYFTKMITMATTFHSIDNIFVCTECQSYHVCDGGEDCCLINMGEGLVCELTGRCAVDSVSFGNPCPTSPVNYSSGHTPCPNQFLDSVVHCVQRDVGLYFSSSSYQEVKDKILICPGELRDEVANLIKITFNHCQHIFQSAQCAYSLICSIYIHVIISVYSSKTIYGNLIFKCTKNKKFDSVAKSIRQAWMSILTTGDTFTTASM
ncbi:orf31 [Alcelaphine gammaherpesvirus 2]|uniref:Orf31 n=1 Tax=Alcelaphine gammaherpesvirus 2 TaxID=138184 RepID=A0A068ADD4_9GAMA|nr:orf31 [Alcelaphine gammaherpesvirus 2]AIA62067.1 orf31 [Alcelaphine gammaherpesvirus 2]